MRDRVPQRLSKATMFSQPVREVMRRQKLLTAPPDTMVIEATRMMAAENVGAVMVIAEQALVGIFTERDAVFRVMARGLDPYATRLADVMTAAPHTIGPERPFGYALAIMHRNGFRHMPVVDKGKPIGIVSSRHALDPDMEEFVSETQRRRHFEELR